MDRVTDLRTEAQTGDFELSIERMAKAKHMSVEDTWDDLWESTQARNEHRRLWKERLSAGHVNVKRFVYKNGELVKVN